MRLIDADELLNKSITVENVNSTGRTKIMVDQNDIDNAPTIDAEPVVHCKDCKYFTNNIADENLRKNFCDRIQVNCFHRVNENDYCSYGAKMDKEGKQ